MRGVSPPACSFRLVGVAQKVNGVSVVVWKSLMSSSCSLT